MNLSSYVKSKLKLAVCMSNYNLKRRFSKFTFFIDICQSFLIPALLGGSQIITALLHLEKYPPPPITILPSLLLELTIKSYTDGFVIYETSEIIMTAKKCISKDANNFFFNVCL